MAKKKSVRWDRIFLVALAIVAIVVLVWQLQSNGTPQTNDNINTSQGTQPPQQLSMDPETVYLTIGSKEFTYGELNAQYQRLDADTRSFYSLDEFIEAGIIPPELLLNKARQSGITVDETVVEGQIEYIEEMAALQGMTFEEYVQNFGFTSEEARKQIRDEILIQEYLDQTIQQNISVSEEEIMALYVMWGIEDQGLTLDEVRDDLEEMAVSEKYNELVREHIEELRTTTPVVYHFSAGAQPTESEEVSIEIVDDELSNETLPVVETEGEVKEFRLTGHMFYFQDEEGNENPDIRVNVGDTVRIVFDNVEGIHDWLIDEIESAFTNLLQPGQSQTIEFTVTESGEFEYYCSYLQHRAMGMAGKLIVE